MRIARIDVFQVDLPYAGGVYRLSGGRTYTSFDSTVVRVTADDGTEGWGESVPFGANYIAAHALGVRAGIEEMASALLDLDPRSVDRVNDAMDDVLAGHHHAKAPIDIACWDLLGRSVGLPVHQLLGGSTGRPMPIISSIGSGPPEDMRARVAEHRERGYRGHSVKIGAAEDEGGPALDAERYVACIADRRPGEFFIADANGGFTPDGVLRFLRLLPDGTDIVLEAPCATWTETLSVRRRCDVPIVLDELAVDEAAVVQAIAGDAADGIGLKVTKSGGLTRSRRTRDLCRAAGLAVSVQDTWGSELAFAAVLHLAQTVPRRLLRCVLDCRDGSPVTTADLDAPVVDGGVTAPSRPGLGAVPRPDVLGPPIATYER